MHRIQHFLKNDWYILVILILSIFPVFLYLGNLPFSSWDESLFAMRAYQILEHGEVLFNFQEFESYKDHSNRKPFLTTLIQVGFWKLFGVSELNLRLPVAFAFLILLLLPAFFRKRLNLGRYTIFSYALLLMTSGSMIRNHVVRTGDQDVFVCLYMFLAAIFFYLYLNGGNEQRVKFRNLFFFFTFCTLFTKTIFAFMFFPGLLIYTIYKKQLFDVLRDKWVYISGAFILVLFVLYNLYMNHHNPYFISGFIDHALGRYGVVVDGQEYKGFSYYWSALYQKGFSWFFCLLILSPFLIFFSSNYKFKDLQLFLWMLGLSFVFIISFSKTKTFWYLVPVFPIVALIIGLNMSYLITRLIDFIGFKPNAVLSLMLFGIIFSLPYKSVMSKVVEHKYLPYYDFELEGAMVNKIGKELPEEKDYTILIRHVNPQTSMYVTWFNELKGYDLKIDIDPVESYRPGQKVLSCNYGLSEKIRRNYRYQALSDWRSCHLMEIQSEFGDLP